jgi:hypothetical protein
MDIKEFQRIDNLIDFKIIIGMIDTSNSYPVYSAIISEEKYNEMKTLGGTYPQIKGFKGLTECLFKSRVELGLEKSLYQIREWFKNRCDIVEGYEFNTDTNKQFDFVKKKEDIPKWAENIKMRMKSCSVMTNKELSLLVQEVLNYGDENIVNMKDMVAKEWDYIRQGMEEKQLRSLQEFTRLKNG